MPDHELPQAGVRAAFKHAGAGVLALDRADDGQVALHNDELRVLLIGEHFFHPLELFVADIDSGVGFADGPGAMASGASNADWRTSWEVNVMAHVYAARAALPGMIERGGGYFLNTVSAAGLLSQIGSASYATTKHAAIGFAEALAIAHGDQGIGVSVLCPQGVATRLLEASERDGPGPQSMDGVITTAEVADCVIEGLARERFLILPHAKVLSYLRHKTADYDRWLDGMRKLRRRYL